MASNIIPFPAGRVKRASSLADMEPPLWTRASLLATERRYFEEIKAGASPATLMMQVWAGGIKKIRADLTAYEAACQAASGNNIVSLRRV